MVSTKPVRSAASSTAPSPTDYRVACAARPLAIGAIVVLLGLPRPAVSKHLGLLRKVSVVAVIKQGIQRVHNLEAEKLKIA
jgi:hypothetical protein